MNFLFYIFYILFTFYEVKQWLFICWLSKGKKILKTEKLFLDSMLSLFG